MTRPADAATLAVESRSPTPKPQRLFCVHHAGGSAQMFHTWARALPDIDVCPIQLPGRARRLSEPLLHTIVDMATDTAAGIRTLLDRPFALFGHSMGALVAFELARRLTVPERARLRGLFVAGAAAPHIPHESALKGHESDAELFERMVSLGGTPDAVGNHPELVEMLAPIIRADFAAVSSYRYVPGPPLDCAIVAFGGRDDTSVPRESLGAWRSYTTRSFSAMVVPGDHFFVRTDPSAVIARIGTVLRGPVASLTR